MGHYLTSSLPGIGGILRFQPSDFFVEEIPLYLPCGEGEHLYLTVEKCGITTFEVLQQLARSLGCQERDIGYAGLKDARAVTRQTISVPKRRPQDIAGVELHGARILAAKCHRNKLRLGHLAGNRFRIRIRRPGADASQRASAILETLHRHGVPNRFGNQRYGVLGNSHRIGRALLTGDFPSAVLEIVGDPASIAHPDWQAAAQAFRAGDLPRAQLRLPQHCQTEYRLIGALRKGRSPRDAVHGLSRKLLRLYLSAYQSSLFDRLLDQRLNALGEMWVGDLAWKHVNGACFEVLDPIADQPRADDFEISPSAPMFGCKVRLATGQAGAMERNLLAVEQLDLQAFRLPGGLTMEGERRPVRVPVSEVSIEQSGEDLLLAFRLPRGSYATAVLHEVMKAPSEAVELVDVLD